MCKAKVAGNIWFSYNSSPDLASKKILLLEFTYCRSTLSMSLIKGVTIKQQNLNIFNCVWMLTDSIKETYALVACNSIAENLIMVAVILDVDQTKFHCFIVTLFR